jgi:hypothetical protein
VEDWPFGLEELEPYYDIIEREVGVSGKAGNINGKIDPRGNIFEGRPPARVSDASASRYWIHREDVGCRPDAWLASISRAGGNHQPVLSGPAGVRLSRLLRSRRLSHQFERLDRGYHDS